MGRLLVRLVRDLIEGVANKGSRVRRSSQHQSQQKSQLGKSQTKKTQN
jgi:hypothetical protein